jgi:site-specific DNA-methyltransferase (adenine-specific)
MIELNKIHNVDFRVLLSEIESGSVDLIVTDPPYKKEFESFYGEMAKEAKRVLRRGGSLITLCGHHQLERILPAMGQYLKYRWILKWDNSAWARMAMGILVTWKPVLWFVNEVFSPIRNVRDTIDSGKREKTSSHPWQQSEEYAVWAIKNLTSEGQLVVDPFAGTGTTLAVANRLKRRWVGAEIDPHYCAVANERARCMQEALAL